MQPDNLSLITTVLLIFAAAIGGGVIARQLKLPTIVGYIAMGVLVGNLSAGSIDHSFLELIAQTGVTLLLFTLGVEFSFLRLQKVLKTILVPAILQIILCIIVFLFLLLGMGLGLLPALFIAAAVSLSSTAVVVKVLSERGELETQPGEVATGWLVVQDVAVIPLMVFLPVIVSVVSSTGGTPIGVTLLFLGSIAKSVLVVGLVLLLAKKGIPVLLRAAANLGSREIFLLTVIAIVFLSAVSSVVAGLSAPLGAFIAGLVIAETSQNHAIFAEVRPLRDIFAVMFFVTLGMGLPIVSVVPVLPIILVMSAAILLIKWFVVFGLSRFVGYHRKTAFIVALSLTQVSEFGFIIAKEGMGLGALTPDTYLLLVAITFTTILVSSPLIGNAHGVYYGFFTSLGRLLPKIFTVKSDLTQTREELPISNHIVLCGYGRVGKYVGRALAMANIPFLVVDYNHTTVRELRDRGIQVVYGDPADRGVLDYAQVDLARAIVIAIPDRHTQELIIGHAQNLNRRIKIICRTHHEEDQARLKSLGVTTIIQPEFEAAVAIVGKVLADHGVSGEEVAGKISRLKMEHGMG